MCLKRILFIAGFSFAMIAAPGTAQERFFTVRDSIEMSTFIDPEARFGWGRDAQVKLSPDAKRFAVVTTRGKLQSDEIEASLWVFNSEAVRNALLSHDTRAVVPKIVAHVAVVTNDGTVISDVKWTPDSKSIVFVGQNAAHGRQLYEADVMNGSVHSLTPPNVYVVRYELADGTGVYTVARPNEHFNRGLKGNAINTGVRVVTGMPISAALFPDLLLKSDDWKLRELWAVRGGKNVRIIDPDSGKPVRPISDEGRARVLSLSPDRRSVIILRLMNRWEPDWESYEPENPYAKFRPGRSGTGPITPWFDLPAEYALVDLGSGKTTSLLNAPVAQFQGYGQALRAIWSRDGRKVLLTATYLPLVGVTGVERSRRSLPCAAAVVEVRSDQVTCLRTMSRSIDPNPLFVREDVSFGRSGEEVLLHLVNIQNENEQMEQYLQEAGAWRRAASFPARDADRSASTKGTGEDRKTGTLSVFVRQGLNQSPVLFATDSTPDQAKKIWDPNPQFSMVKLGEASVLRWKDISGHAWVAGLVKPPDYVAGTRYPLVIQTHGFVENRFLTDGGYTTALAARPLASAGIVVLQMPINREHFVTAQELPDQLVGFESAIDLLVSEKLIDPARVGIIGFSRTCYHVEAALIKDSKRFAAATIADGADESYMQYMLYSVGTETAEQEAIYGTKPFGEGLKAWIKSAPGFNLDKIETPLRIEAIDGIGLLAEWEIYASLSLQRKPVDFILFPNGVHTLQKPLERLASQQGNVDWFRFWLKGEEDLDPAKAAQYKRWRELRKLQKQNEKNSPASSPN